MVIGIEAQRIFRKKKHGMDMVALMLIKELQKIDHVNQYYIFVKPDEDRSVLKETENFKIIELGGGPYPTWEQFALPRKAKQLGCEILHCTSNTAPVYSNIPLVVTLHDIIYMEKSYLKILQDSGTTYQKFGNIYRRYFIPKMIRKVRKMITVSNFEKDRINKFFSLKPNLLEAVYNGVSQHFKPVTESIILNEIKSKYRLPDKFFFFLGNTDPKKNTIGVLKAMKAFLQANHEGYKLVMPDYEEEELQRLLRSIDAPEMREKIHLTGYIVNTDLPAIISLSRLFLYPSLRESFGIPILEGMACGVPVITSNTSSMPEVAGDAACIIDPYQPVQITKAMFDLLEDSELRRKFIEKGLSRAADFSWQNMAKHVLTIYQEVYQNIK